MRVNFTNCLSLGRAAWVKLGLSSLMIVLFCFTSVQAQNRTVSGKVTSAESGESLPGVNVIVKGTTVGTVTDIDGNYKLNVPQDASTLVFSFIGLAEREVAIGDRSSINIEMNEDAQQLSEVVVQAYGAKSEKLNVQQIETVNADNFRDFPVVSPQELLQGQASGIQVTGSSGVIGTSQNVRIRGVASINAGTQPLYVLDGVPLNDASGGAEGYSDEAGGSALNPIFNLNPNDIESMTVLKDASATALYGSRGANGVVLITTKKGSAGQKTQFSFDYFTGWSEPTVLKDVLSADEWRQFRSDYLTARGTPTEPSSLPQTGYNWLDGVTQTGRTNSYSLSARGGTDKTTFYVGGTYFNSSSYQIGNDVDKINGRLNLTHEATDKVRFGLNLGLSSLTNDRFFQENSTGSPLTVGYLQLPYLEPYDADGNFQDVGFDNPLASQALNTFEFVSQRTTGNVYAEFEPIERLILRTDWGIDNVLTETKTRTVDLFLSGGSAGREIIQDDKWVSTNTASYSFDLEDNMFTVLGGFSYETSVRDDIEVGSQGFISDALPNVVSGATPTTTEATGTEWSLYSLFGRLNYNYSNRYILEGNIRRDGSSRFGANNRYGVFWAVSGGWLISEESFFPENSAVNFLKLTSSYGISGNDRIDNFASLGLYGAGRDYNGYPGLEAAQPANPDLTWEETSQLDVSLSAHFLDSRLRLDASWYNKVTTDLLLDVPILTTTGFTSRTENAGELLNRGIDINLAADIIEGPDFRWTAQANIGFLHNEVLELPGASVDPFGNQFVSQAAFGSQRAVVGSNVNEFFIIRYNGINPQTGDPEWLNRDGEPTNSPTSDDRVYVGSALPSFSGGITNAFQYKGLELRIFANFVSGSKSYVSDNEFSYNIAASGAFNMSGDVLDYWTTVGENATVPALRSDYIADFNRESTLHLFDASYLRIKNIRLSYNIPNNLLESSNFFDRAVVYVQAQNAFTLFSDLKEAGIDPEVNNGGTDTSAQGETFFTSPQARTITVGVSLGF
ncbi:TonB-dependent receptor [Porifericola rhodea]|uniref:SusC/RagA family TonB-linked outer membrane protein n=1 Tax=Porifericola rhodea TaxID=930972 RepID=UPI0026661E61|nr:TonB-dependent receptor [Porifericola rhodea]WKN29668.1 TonB-dependent receptor [Porifericola rhodea]